uniref:RNA-directed DNA polymerase n=1 Tax=Haemonchus contortus TaxID=6289 RepID=A0A7I4YT76_HAECO
MEEDSEMAQSLADELESANQEFTGEADVNLTVSEIAKAVEKLRSEVRKIRTVVDDALGMAFRTNSEVRETVYSAVSDQIEVTELQLNRVRTLALKGTRRLDDKSRETLEVLASLYGCDIKEIVQHSVEQSEKIENLQAELLRVKAIEGQRITERRKLLLTGQEPMESELNEQRSNAGNNTEGIQRTPLTATSEAMDYSSSGQRGKPQLLRRNSTSSEDSVVSQRSTVSTAHLINEYMRAAAMPNVKPFSNKKGEKFKDFLRQFNLKYPDTTWRDNERRDILVGLLEGEAKMHYNTLSKEIQNGSLQTLVEALKVRLKVDGPEEQARAMRKLRSLKKKSNQSVLEFCLELEVLSVKAHPKADETALAFIRAEILQEQLSQWPEAIQLLEILETEQGNKVYEKMKETALRIERLRDSVKWEKPHPRQWQPKPKEGYQIVKDGGRSIATEKKNPKKLGEQAPHKSNKEIPNCSYCGKKGHVAEGCWHKKKDRQAVSFSATLDSWSCNLIGTNRNKCGELGKKHLVTLTCLGTKVTGMIDTGSQLTIVPLRILKEAKDRGEDMDVLCRELPNPEIDAYDASGNKMKFLGCVEFNLGIEGGKEHPVKVFVKNMRDNVILLGTNVLEILGIHIRIDKDTRTEEAMCNTGKEKQDECPGTTIVEGDHSRGQPEEEFQQEDSREEQTRQQTSLVTAGSLVNEATVVKRVYVSPGGCVPIQISSKGCQKVATLCSIDAHIPTGVCALSKEGTTEIPVLNHTAQPIIFREGQKVGTWEEAHSIHSALRDMESDMLEVSKGVEPDRINTLMKQLVGNRELDCFAERLTKVITTFQDVFALSDKELTQTDLIEHGIDTGDTKAIKQRTRPVPQGVRPELKNILDDLEERKIIRKSTSDWASPIVLVQKKDKTLRLCVDYRALNKHTKRDSYPLPITDTLLQSLGGKKFFSTLDMASGYWQIKLTEDAQNKSAFTTPEGLYEFLVLPFGLCTSPAVFQRLMDRVLGDLKGEEVFVYIDDILVATDSEERHLQMLTKVFEAFREAKLKFKPQKCRLMEQQVSFLGHIINEKGVNMDPDKVAKILNYPKPSNLAELRTFLGLCGYYRKFILRFSSIAKPLFDLTSTKTPFVWSVEQEHSFENLKKVIASAPVLGQPNIEKAKTGEKPYIIYTDASTIGVGAVLCQEGADNLLHPLYFTSKRLSKTEQRYHITDIEALAIIYAVKKFHFFVFGMKTIIRTDHQPLTTLFKRNNVSPRVIRWALELQAYDLEIQYVKGSANKVADALSRGVTNDPTPEEDGNGNIRVVNSVECETEWLRELKNDSYYNDVIEKLREGKIEDEVLLPRQAKKLKVCDFCIHEGNLHLILEDGSLAKVVPKSKRLEVFNEVHSGPVSGHFNAREISKFLKNRVFWEGLQQDVAKWCAECRNCFLTDDRKNKPPPLKPFEVSKPFEVIGVDVLEVGPSSNGMRYLVVVIDHLSKWLEVPCKSAEQIAKVLLKRWIAEGGRWPKRIHSDRGKEFENSVMEALCRASGITQSFTKGYNPRENGVTERANKTILRMLKKRGGITSEWDEVIPHVVYAYNISPHEATNESPFFILHGFDPVFPSNVIPSDELSPYRIDADDYKTSLMSGIKTIQEIVKENNELYRKRMKECYDKIKKTDESRAPKVGERVFMRMPAEKGKTKHPKLTIDWAGPYRVIEVSSNSAVITKINANEEPIQVQFDLLRIVPSYISDTPVETVSKRRKAKIDVKSIQAIESSHCRSGRKQLILSEDTSHPLHLKFVCDENQLVKPPGNYNGYLIGFKCPLAKEENARKLSSVLLNISVTMKDVTFDSIGRLAQLVTIWMKDDWSEDFKLLMMAKPQHSYGNLGRSPRTSSALL